MTVLYRKLGNYTAVGREIGRSGSTVSRYVNFNGVPQNVMLAVQRLLNEK